MNKHCNLSKKSNVIQTTYNNDIYGLANINEIYESSLIKNGLN